MKTEEILAIIEDADNITTNHHEMTAHAISDGLASLNCKLANIDRQRDEEAELLEKAQNAVNRVSDRYEMHHGGGATQL